MTRRVFSVVVALLISLLAVPISRASADPIVVIAGGSSVTVDDPLEGPITTRICGAPSSSSRIGHFGSGNGRLRLPTLRGPARCSICPKLFLDTQDEGAEPFTWRAPLDEAGGLELQASPTLPLVFLQLFAVPVALASLDERERSTDDAFQAAGDISWSFGLTPRLPHSACVFQRPGHRDAGARPHQGPCKRGSVELRQPALRFHAGDARAGNAHAHQRRLGRCRNSREKTPRPENPSSVVNEHADGVTAFHRC